RGRMCGSLGRMLVAIIRLLILPAFWGVWAVESICSGCESKSPQGCASTPGDRLAPFGDHPTGRNTPSSVLTWSHISMALKVGQEFPQVFAGYSQKTIGLYYAQLSFLDITFYIYYTLLPGIGCIP